MARYYLHLRDEVDIVLDEEGSEYADIELLKKAVMRNARDIMSGDVKASGMIDLRLRIDAEDVDGKIIHTLPFSEAVNIIAQ